MQQLSGELNTGKGDGGRGKGTPDPERLFEGAGPLIERLRAEGPFRSGAALVERAREILGTLTEAELVAVINAHPRIGERPERVRAQSERSFREQGYHEDATPPAVFEQLARLNAQYERRFGFRFVVFVNRRSQASLIPVLEARLERSKDEERAAALREILAIAEDRLTQRGSC